MRQEVNSTVRLILLVAFCSGIICPLPADAMKEVQLFVIKKPSHSVVTYAFSENGRYILTGSGDGVKIWDLAAGGMRRTMGGKNMYLGTVFSPDAKYVLLQNLEPEQYGENLWDISKGKVMGSFNNPWQSSWPQISSSIHAFSPDNRFLLAVTFNGPSVIRGDNYLMHLLDAATGKKLKTFEGQGHFGKISTATFSPDGRYVLSGGDDYTLKLWDVSTGKLIKTFEGHMGEIGKVSFSLDGRYALSAVTWGEIRAWDISTGEQVRIFEARGIGNTIALSPKNRYLLAPDSYNSVALWDFSTGKKIHRFEIEDAVAVTFSPDGRYAISGNSSETIKIWNVETGKEIAVMNSFGDGEWVVITPEGYFNASPNAARHIKIQIGGNAYSIDHFYERFYNPGLIVKKLTGKETVMAYDIRKGVATPPTVLIKSPTSGGSYDKEAVEIVVEARDAGGGVDEVRLYHNECVVGEFGKGIALKKPSQDKVEKRYKITLIPGENTFRAVGFSKDRTEGRPHEIVVRYTGAGKKAELYLVTVGINDYKNSTMQLNYAVADAAGMKTFFEQKSQGLFNKVHIKEIYNADATKEKIKKVLSELRVKEQDVVLLYLSGHGQTIGDEWYFICYDVVYPEKDDHVKEKGISSTEMTQMVRNIPALKKSIFIDACESGGVLVALARGVAERRAIAQLARSTGTHVIAASTGKQIAYENVQLGHGIFTYTLLQGLKGEAEGRDKTVTVRGLITYIEGALPEMSVKHGQDPQYPVVDSRGQDFPLVVHQ